MSLGRFPTTLFVTKATPFITNWETLFSLDLRSGNDVVFKTSSIKRKRACCVYIMDWTNGLQALGSDYYAGTVIKDEMLACHKQQTRSCFGTRTSVTKKLEVGNG